MEKQFILKACQCGYPHNPCNKKKHNYGHLCIEANIKIGLIKETEDGFILIDKF